MFLASHHARFQCLDIGTITRTPKQFLEHNKSKTPDLCYKHTKTNLLVNGKAIVLPKIGQGKLEMTFESTSDNPRTICQRFCH